MSVEMSAAIAPERIRSEIVTATTAAAGYRSATMSGMSQAATLKARRHVDLRRQASALCAVPVARD
jgi:hypothetical protein